MFKRFCMCCFFSPRVWSTFHRFSWRTNCVPNEPCSIFGTTDRHQRRRVLHFTHHRHHILSQVQNLAPDDDRLTACVILLVGSSTYIVSCFGFKRWGRRMEAIGSHWIIMFTYLEQSHWNLASNILCRTRQQLKYLLAVTTVGIKSCVKIFNNYSFQRRVVELFIVFFLFLEWRPNGEKTCLSTIIEILFCHWTYFALVYHVAITIILHAQKSITQKNILELLEIEPSPMSC